MMQQVKQEPSYDVSKTQHVTFTAIRLHWFGNFDWVT